MPLQHPQIQSGNEEGLQVHALLGPRGSGPGASLHQGLPDRMFEVRQQRGHEVHCRGAFETTARELWIRKSRRLRSTIDWRNARHLCSARCDRSRTLRRTAEEPRDSLELHSVEVAVQASPWGIRYVRASRRVPSLRSGGTAQTAARTAKEGGRQWQARLKDSTKKPAAPLSASAEQKFISASYCVTRSTRGFCTGWLPSSSFWRCSPDSESIFPGCSAGSRLFSAADHWLASCIPGSACSSFSSLGSRR